MQINIAMPIVQNNIVICHCWGEVTFRQLKSGSLAVFRILLAVNKFPEKAEKQQWMDIVCVAYSSVAWPLLLPKHY